MLPAATPVTTPLLVTVATPGLLLTHVPPDAPPVFVSVVFAPIHIDDEPLNVPAATDAAIDISFCELTGPLQPATVYVIIVLPAAIQLISPVPAFTVAILVLSLLHAPPVVPSVVNTVLVPGHKGISDPPVTVPAVAVDVTVTGKVAVCVPVQPNTE